MVAFHLTTKEQAACGCLGTRLFLPNIYVLLEFIFSAASTVLNLFRQLGNIPLCNCVLVYPTVLPLMGIWAVSHCLLLCMRVQWAFPFECPNVRVLASLGCMPRKEAKVGWGVWTPDNARYICKATVTIHAPNRSRHRNRTVIAISGVHQGSDPS